MTKKKLLILYTAILMTGCYTLPEEKVTEPDPNAAFNVYSEAQELYLEEQYDEALRRVDIAIKRNPFIAQFYHLKGDILFKKEHFGDALKSYREVVSIRSHNPEIFEKMGLASSRLGAYEEAIQYHKKALAQNPKRIEINLKIAQNYHWMNQYQLAYNFAENYNKKAVLSDKRRDPEYFRIMGNLAYDQHAYKEAKENYEFFFSEVTAAEAWEAKALLHTYMELSQIEKAYRFLTNRANAWLPEGDVHFFRGLYYYKIDNFKDARFQLELALKARSNEKDVYLYLGRLYYAAGETQKALEMYQEYRKQGGNAILEEIL